MGLVLKFIQYVGGLIWKYGVQAVNAIINWVRANAKTVQTWLERGVGYGTIIQWILQILGIG